MVVVKEYFSACTQHQIGFKTVVLNFELNSLYKVRFHMKERYENHYSYYEFDLKKNIVEFWLIPSNSPTFTWFFSETRRFRHGILDTSHSYCFSTKPSLLWYSVAFFFTILKMSFVCTISFIISVTSLIYTKKGALQHQSCISAPMRGARSVTRRD